MKTELVTTLRIHVTKTLTELHDSKEPVLLQDIGQRVACLLDVDDYEAMQNRLNILEGTCLGEVAIHEGRTLSHSNAREKMKKYLVS